MQKLFVMLFGLLAGISLAAAGSTLMKSLKARALQNTATDSAIKSLQYSHSAGYLQGYADCESGIKPQVYVKEEVQDE